MSKKLILQILISSLRIIGVTALLLFALYAIYHVQYTYIDGFILDLKQGPEFNDGKVMENAAWIVKHICYILPIALLALVQTLPYIPVMRKKPAIGHLEKGIEAILAALLFLFAIIAVFSLALAHPNTPEWLEGIISDTALEKITAPEDLHDAVMWLSVQFTASVLWVAYHFARYGYLAHPRADVLEAEKIAEEVTDVDELGEESENKIAEKVLTYLEFRKSKKNDGGAEGAKDKNDTHKEH